MQKPRGTNLWREQTYVYIYIYGERHTHTKKRVMSGVGRLLLLLWGNKSWTTVPTTKNHTMDVLVDNPKVTFYYCVSLLLFPFLSVGTVRSI